MQLMQKVDAHSAHVARKVYAITSPSDNARLAHLLFIARGWLAARRPNWTERHALFILENGLTKKTVRPSIRQTKHLIVHLRLTIERAVTASDSTVSDGLRLQIFFVTIFTS